MKDATPSSSDSSKQPKLLDQLRSRIRDNHYSLQNERAYVYWARWYIRFHDLRHPMNMGEEEIRTFLSYLNNERHISIARITAIGKMSSRRHAKKASGSPSPASADSPEVPKPRNGANSGQIGAVPRLPFICTYYRMLVVVFKNYGSPIRRRAWIPLSSNRFLIHFAASDSTSLACCSHAHL